MLRDEPTAHLRRGFWFTSRIKKQTFGKLNMLRDLLVHVDGSQAGRQRLQLAIDLALRTDARLSGLHVMPPPDVTPLYKPSQMEEAVANMSLKLASNARAAKKAFNEEVAPRLADTRWFEADGDVVDGICDRARYADLVILGQYERQGPQVTHPLPIAHSVVLRCGRPVLVVPAAVGPISFAKAAIAWDGSREAVRAVHDALPLLALSQSVEIVTIIAPSAVENADDAKHLSAHLANHGIEIEAGAIQIRSEEEPVALRQQMEKADYDLLIMGGYSHLMWLKFIFGGATQSILLSSKIPVLVSH
jgi:nucleotide-binding universal stress UspA family protein